MTVKRFEAATMAEVLNRVRAELGKDALIMETRRFTGASEGGRSRERVEVLAASGIEPSDQIEAWMKDILAIIQPPVPGKREALMARLGEAGVQQNVAEKILSACGPEYSALSLMQEIARLILVSPTLPTGAGTRVALIGPTGVGKTTTLAKLAARYALLEGKRLALVTTDTYRIGAVDQLRVYARVMKLPLEIADTPQKMEEAVARHRDKDLILIDTVGRSPQGGVHLTEMRDCLRAAQPTETHLTLAAPYSLEYLFNAADAFMPLAPNRLILTKMDEMPRCGIALSLVRHTGLPISFLTDGQEVPRNLRPAHAGEIAIHILGDLS